MRWAIPALVGFAEQPGWVGNDLTVAVSVALATSDGDDAWSWSPGGVPPVTQCGLWGIDPAAVEPNVAAQLTDPRVNAGVAYAIWNANDGSWVWSPAWAGGAWRGFTSDVQAVIAGRDRTQPATGDGPRAGALAALSALGTTARDSSGFMQGAVSWLKGTLPTRGG